MEFKNGATFSLIDPADDDLYYKMKNVIVCGPSIIFSRYHKAGETYIRGDENYMCKSVLGLDFNMLYLYSIMQPMCVNNYIRRKKEDNFRPITRKRKYISMFDWMDWLSFTRNIDIKHTQNYSEELRVAGFLIDGIISGTIQLFEYCGCWVHGHDCIYVNNKLTDQERTKRFKKHDSKMKFLIEQGYDVELIWECQFHREKQINKELQSFVQSRRLPFHEKFPREVMTKQILDSVIDDTFFGFLEDSLEVPDMFEKSMYKPETNLTSNQYLSKFSPIFCISEVPFECIGEHMQNFVK